MPCAVEREISSADRLSDFCNQAVKFLFESQMIEVCFEDYKIEKWEKEETMRKKEFEESIKKDAITVHKAIDAYFNAPKNK